jgi:hypothetical protein
MPSTSVYVKDYGVVADGVTNDLPAFQAALNYAATLSRGAEVVLTHGKMALSGTPTYSGKPLRIVGEGQEVSVISQRTAGAHGLDATFSAYAGDAVYPLILEGFSLEAAVGGAGEAIKATWAKPGGIANQHCDLKDIYVRSSAYGSSSHYWTRGIHLKNSAVLSARNISVVQLGAHCQDNFWLECDADAVCFGANLSHIDLQGAVNGFRCTGWIEGINFANFAAVAINAMVLDGSGSTIPGNQNPLVTLSNGHLNGAEKALFIDKFKSIHLTNMNLVANCSSDNTSGTCYGIYAYRSGEITIANSLFNDIGSPTSIGVLIALLTCQGIAISGSRFLINQGSGIQKDAIRVSNESSNVRIYGNSFVGNGARAGTAIFAQNAATNLKLVARNNYFDNFTRSTWLIDPGSSRVEDNDSVNVTLSHAVGGLSITENYRTSGNTPFEHPTLNVNDATPTVAGIPTGANVFVSNTSPTTITNLDDGFAGQEITLIPTNGNTTVGHVTNIFLQGSVAFVMPAWGSLTLQKVNFGGSTIWIEKGRRA